MLLAENRKMIDPIAKHLFFVRDPVRVVVKGATESEVKLRLHPSNDFGFREYRVNDTFYISGDDARAIKEGETLRLKDLMAVRITGNGNSRISAEKVEGADTGRILQWVSEGNLVKCSVIIPGEIIDDKDNFLPDSLETAEGFVESYAKKLGEHEIVQFERFGYCILDNKELMQFIFTSE
jgi:glutamyl-tRNA synthetase